MQIRLGLVCPRRMRAAFDRAAASLSGVIPRWVCYEHEDEIRPQVEQTLPDCDALCFSGDLPLDRCRGLIPADLPTSVVQLTSVDMALCLLRARDSGLPYTPMSIDSIETLLIDELVSELDIDPAGVARLPHGPDVTVDDVLAFHRSARADLGTAFAVTGRSNAIAPLQNTLGVPVFVAVPAVSSIRAAMNRAALGAVSNRYADLRFAAAVFRVVAESDLIQSEVRRLGLARALHDSIDFNEAWVEARSGGQDVLVFGHKGLMQRVTQEWTAVPIAHDLQQSLGLRVAVGFGLGSSARHSVEYAEAAVRRAARDGGNCAYMLSEDGVVIGPMRANGGNTARYQFKTDNGQITNLARKVGLSIGTVSRLLAYERKLGSEAVSAADIGRALRLTPPSGRRIVRALKDQGVLTSVGVSQPTGRGRPASLYRLELERHISGGDEPT